MLDTFPYGAHTTANDALLAGLPVLTCAGETLTSRIAGSQLNAIGLPELVTTSLAAYETLALDLARDPAALSALRSAACRESAHAAAVRHAALCARLCRRPGGRLARSRRQGAGLKQLLQRLDRGRDAE